MVYVLDIEGKPLMPTERTAWVAYALKHGEAKVVRREPFTIKLLRPSTKYLQAVTLGVDTGSRHVGLSASTEKRELYHAQVELRTDVSQLLTARREMRRGRRGRKHNWYRPARWANRANEEGNAALPPSVEHKADSHIRAIKFVCKILPISELRVELGKFDTQRIQNPEIHNEQYQQGTLSGWENLKAYAKWRDGQKCRACGKSPRDDSSVRLEVHHIRRRADGGSDTPDNVVTLCHECHEAHHQGIRKLKLKRPPVHRNEAHMNSMRKYLREEVLRNFDYLGIRIRFTYGYETAIARREHNIEKSHANDAFCVAGNFYAHENSFNNYLHRQMRRHRRNLHDNTIQSPKEIKDKSKLTAREMKYGYRRSHKMSGRIRGFSLWDTVKFNGSVYIASSIIGSDFRLGLQKLEGNRVIKKAMSKCKLLSHNNNLVTVRVKTNNSHKVNQKENKPCSA